MSYTPAEIAEAVWTYPVRTLDAGTPEPSNGSVIDDIVYAAWAYHTRTLQGQTAYSMPAEAGAFTVQGQATRLRSDRRIPAGAGAVVLAGQPAALKYQRISKAEAGAFALAGNPAQLKVTRSLKAELVAFALSGQNVRFTRGRSILVGAGAFALSGADNRLKYNRAIKAIPGIFLLNGQPARLRIIQYVTLSGVSRLILAIDGAAEIRTGAIAGAMDLVQTVNESSAMVGQIEVAAEITAGILGHSGMTMIVEERSAI